MAATDQTEKPKPRARSRRGANAETAKVAERYFGAVVAKDLDEMAACWTEDGLDRLYGQVDLIGPREVRAYFAELFAALPDFSFEIVDMVVEGTSASVRWRATGTFTGPGTFMGFDPNGARLELEGVDVATVDGDRISENHAYIDGMTIARQLGVVPPADSPTELRMRKVVNARTKLAAKIADPPEEIADGVWIVRGGFPRKAFNVYFLRDGDGVVMFDAAIKAMTNSLAAAGAQLGGITRVVLGHGHADHRGAAAGLHGVPIHCHVDEVADAEGDGGAHYFDFSKLARPARWLYPGLLKTWDGGPVKIDGTVEEGDDVAGFKVVHIPGHAPGLIALWRESDRLAIVSDGFYTADPEKFKPGPPIVAHPAFNWDTDKARASVRKLAELDPAVAWPGHAEPLTGDVKGQLLRAADA